MAQSQSLKIHMIEGSVVEFAGPKSLGDETSYTVEFVTSFVRVIDRWGMTVSFRSDLIEKIEEMPLPQRGRW